MAKTTRPASPPAVTPKGHATRGLILQAAAEAFTESGYAATTLSDLIARTGLAKGAFYFHFASKEQLAFAVLEGKQAQWRQAVERDVLSHPAAQMRAWIRLVAGIISRCQQDGVLPADLDPEELATILVAVTDGLKDISEVLDAPSRARRGFEHRLHGLAALIDTLLAAHPRQPAG